MEQHWASPTPGSTHGAPGFPVSFCRIQIGYALRKTNLEGSRDDWTWWIVLHGCDQLLSKIFSTGSHFQPFGYLFRERTSLGCKFRRNLRSERNDAESLSSIVPAGFKHDSKRMKSRKGFAISTISLLSLLAMGKETKAPEAVPSIGSVTQPGHHSTTC